MGREDKKKMECLINLFLYDEYRVVQRSSWIISGIAERKPLFIKQYLPYIISRIMDEALHVAVRRNVVRLLQFVEIPESLKGSVLNACFSFLENPKEGNAVQAFSVTVIEKFINDFPEIIPEFKLILERHLENGASAAFESRAKRTLQRLL